jgi:uncharacterized membrane protein
MRLFGIVSVYVLALVVTAYAVLTYTLLPLGAAVHPDMAVVFLAHKAGIYTHVLASSVALFLAPFQLLSRLRRRPGSIHRWVGRLYLAAGVLPGGLSALYMSYFAFGGLAAKLGFACLALLWLYTGVQAFRAIRRGAVVEHRRWAVRNLSLTLAAVTLRIYLPTSAAAGIPFELAYPFVAWLCWVPNLLIAEWAFNGVSAEPFETTSLRVSS